MERLYPHLIQTHRMKALVRRAVKARFENVPVVQREAEMEPLPNGSPPLSYLVPPVPGFHCGRCSYKTTNRDAYRRHARKLHDLTSGKLDREDTRCLLQCWTRWSPGGVKYWCVDMTAVPEGYRDVASVDQSSRSASRMQGRWTTEEEAECEETIRMEAEEEARLSSEQAEGLALGEQLEHDENTEWLRGSQWPKWFQDRPLHLISAMATLPSGGRDTDRFIAAWNTIEWTSRAQYEASLRKLILLTTEVLARCEETLLHTPRTLRCWLRSWKTSFMPYPFEMVRTANAKKRYYSYWTRFLCYIFRVRVLCRDLLQSMQEVFGLQLSKAQVQMMDYIWVELHTATRAAVGAPSSPELLEKVFQLFVIFWTDFSPDGSMDRSPIVHFSGVLGIHPQELLYRRAYDYTPYLSALIWVGRLIILEYALPLREYGHLTTPWPARMSYSDQVARLCEQIRPKYLLRGSISPIGYLIERLQHGRAIAKREGSPTNICWSLDYQTLSIADSHISMQQFRYMMHCLVARTEQQTRVLMLGWSPESRLRDLKDNMSTHRPGHSFLSEPSNQLQNSFRMLSRRAFSKEHGFALKGEGRLKALKYLKMRDRLVKYLFAAIHLTSGMPARGQELRVIRWADTSAVPRNIFIYRGHIVLVFQYNKATTNSNNSFYIVRVPCPILQIALFHYLAYVRPFSDFLSRQLKIVQSPTTNPHLFTSHGDPVACYSREACTKSVRDCTPECPIKLNLRLYRQIAISIAKKHIPALIQPFDANTPNDYTGFLNLLSYQTGHRPATHSGSYALEKGFPTKLQPDLIDRYTENSLAWHRYICLAEDNALLADVDMGRDWFSTAPQAPAYHPCPEEKKGVEEYHDTIDLSSDFDTDARVEANTPTTRRKRKLDNDTCSPALKKIKDIQKELNQMIKNYEEGQSTFVRCL